MRDQIAPSCLAYNPERRAEWSGSQLGRECAVREVEGRGRGAARYHESAIKDGPRIRVVGI
jgi:hypothetical protein